MKPTKRAYFRALGSNFVIFQRRKQIFIDLNGIIKYHNQTIFFFSKTTKIQFHLSR
jgi:hypothetical protein